MNTSHLNYYVYPRNILFIKWDRYSGQCLSQCCHKDTYSTGCLLLQPGLYIQNICFVLCLLFHLNDVCVLYGVKIGLVCFVKVASERDRRYTKFYYNGILVSWEEEKLSRYVRGDTVFMIEITCYWLERCLVS